MLENGETNISVFRINPKFLKPLGKTSISGEGMEDAERVMPNVGKPEGRAFW